MLSAELSSTMVANILLLSRPAALPACLWHFYIPATQYPLQVVFSIITICICPASRIYFHPGAELLLQALFQINYLGGFAGFATALFLPCFLRATFGFSLPSVLFLDFGSQQLRSGIR